jgi:hypothetical protein
MTVSTSSSGAMSTIAALCLNQSLVVRTMSRSLGRVWLQVWARAREWRSECQRLPNPLTHHVFLHFVTKACCPAPNP